MKECPESPFVNSLLDEELDAIDAAQVRGHLADCRSCRRQVKLRNRIEGRRDRRFLVNAIVMVAGVAAGAVIGGPIGAPIGLVVGHLAFRVVCGRAP